MVNLVNMFNLVYVYTVRLRTRLSTLLKVYWYIVVCVSPSTSFDVLGGV